MNTPLSTIEFSLPPELEASAPPEARGLMRDQVRLMVSKYSTDHVEHTRFYNLHKFLRQATSS
jgi:S-adenosylmethionine:tRNA ribosyltransferase-isomerase